MDVASERQRFSEARRREVRDGCLFFWLLFVGQATKSDSLGSEIALQNLLTTRNENFSLTLQPNSQLNLLKSQYDRSPYCKL